MNWRVLIYVTVAVAATLIWGVMFVLDPWPAVFAYLGTVAILGPLIAWAKRRHNAPPYRRPGPAPSTVNITYNVLNVHGANPADLPRSVGGAVYRQAPGVPRELDAAHHQEDLP